MKKHFLPVLCCIMLLSSCLQNSDKNSFPLNPADYQADFNVIVNIIRDRHLGYPEIPLQIMPPAELKALVEETNRTLETVTDRRTFYLEMRRFISLMNDGHMNLIGQDMIRPESLLPLRLGWFAGSLHIIATGPEYIDLLYAEVMEVAGLPTAEFEEQVNRFFPADKGNIYWKRRPGGGNTIAMINTDFLKHLGLYSEPEGIRIKYKTGGVIKKRSIAVGGGVEVAYDPRCRNTLTAYQPKNFYRILKEQKTIYFQLNRLSAAVDKSLYKRLFSDARAHDVGYLVLDLRNNTGGNSLWCDIFLKYIIPKTSKLYIYNSWQRQGDINITSRGPATIKPEAKELIFPGKLILLTGPNTFSSATFFVVAVKDNNLGTIVGGPCGNNSIRYGYGEKIVLPNTGMTFKSTIRIWERALPGIVEQEPFLLPDHPVEYTVEDYKDKRDPVWDFVVSNLIKGVFNEH